MSDQQPELVHDRQAWRDAFEDGEWCPEDDAPAVIVETFEDQTGFEEQARPVVVTRLDCGHEIVTPGRWGTS